MLKERVKSLLSEALVFDEYIMSKAKSAEENRLAAKTLKGVSGNKEDLKRLVTNMKISEVEYMTAMGQYGQMTSVLREAYNLLKLSGEQIEFTEDEVEYLKAIEAPRNDAYVVEGSKVKVVDEEQYGKMIEKLEEAITDEELDRILAAPFFNN